MASLKEILNSILSPHQRIPISDSLDPSSNTFSPSKSLDLLLKIMVDTGSKWCHLEGHVGHWRHACTQGLEIPRATQIPRLSLVASDLISVDPRATRSTRHTHHYSFVTFPSSTSSHCLSFCPRNMFQYNSITHCFFSLF